MDRYRERQRLRKPARLQLNNHLQALARKEDVKKTIELNANRLEEIPEVNSEEVQSIDSEFYRRGQVNNNFAL